MASEVVCCFCGEWLLEDHSVQISIFPTVDRDEAQSLYCHRQCLADRLASNVPKHPALLDSNES